MHNSVQSVKRNCPTSMNLYPQWRDIKKKKKSTLFITKAYLNNVFA